MVAFVAAVGTLARGSEGEEVPVVWTGGDGRGDEMNLRIEGLEL
jgi:anthranilate phosphoribosyltransferase